MTDIVGRFTALQQVLFLTQFLFHVRFGQLILGGSTPFLFSVSVSGWCFGCATEVIFMTIFSRFHFVCGVCGCVRMIRGGSDEIGRKVRRFVVHAENIDAVN